MGLFDTVGSILQHGVESDVFDPAAALWRDGENLFKNSVDVFEAAFRRVKEIVVHLFLFLLGAVLFVGILLLILL